MAVRPWQVFRRRADQSLLEHLCRVRQIDPRELEMDFAKHLHSPDLLPQMDKARSLMVTAVKNNWPVAIFGDYDADGTPAAALLASVCERLGLVFEVHLPTRQTGYGLSESFVAPVAKRAKLLITVDTGISAVGPIRRLNKLGVKTIILDHHLPPAGELPPADAIVDPFLEGSEYPFPHLCGCALAYKFACALQRDFPVQLTDGFLKWQLDLVAISTVADMMPMNGENRTLVHYGLKVLKKTRRLGLKAMLESTGLKLNQLTAGTIGFTIGPRFNAAGRLGDNRPVYDLLTTDDPVRAAALAGDIEALNRQRRGLVETILAEAEEVLFNQNQASDFAYTIVKDAWSPGVIGLVAGRLADKYYRPVVVGSRADGEIRASARSVSEYPIIDGLTAVGSHLEQFGGHRQAAGLTVRQENWELFTTELKAHATRYLDGVLPQLSLRADGFLTLTDATLTQARELSVLEPHGISNARPIFIVRDVELKDAQPIGQTRQHLRLTLANDSHQLPAIGFSLVEKFARHKSNRADIAGHLTENIWNGRSSVQFQLVDFKRVGNDIQEIDKS